jgi:hypothetical protein
MDHLSTDVEAGTYELYVQFDRPMDPKVGFNQTEATARADVIVPGVAGERSDEAFDVGQIEPKPYKLP